MPVSAATWSMPLKGVRLLYMHETDAAILIGLETESKAVACPACQSASVVGYGKMSWRIRDLPIKKKAVFLEIKRRRLRCRDCLVTFNEPVPYIAANHRATSRLVQNVWKMALRYPFSMLSKIFEMDEKTIRNIFQGMFESAASQFRLPPYPPAPSALAVRVPMILRRQRALWINLDQATLIDMDESVTPESVRQTLQRVAAGSVETIFVAPDSTLIRALQAASRSQLLLHPPALRAACTDLIESVPAASAAMDGAASYIDALSRLVKAKSEPEARRLWQDLAYPPPALEARMRPLIDAVGLLPSGCLAAFDHPDHACDTLAERLETILSGDFSRRSYDVICAIVLLDKTLQKTARRGVAESGVHLDYQKANYGTSLAKLVARLERLTRGSEASEAPSHEVK